MTNVNMQSGGPVISAEAVLNTTQTPPIKKLVPPEKPTRSLKCEPLKGKSHIEMMDDAVETLMLDAYFSKVFNHCLIDPQVKDSMWVYCDPSYLKFEVKDAKDITVDDIKLTITFTEWAEQWYSPWSKPSIVVDVTEIRMNGMSFAMYNRKDNVLYMSDVTHGEKELAVLQKVWPRLIRELGMEEVPAKERKAIEITIGSDPELEVVDEYGAVVNAQNYLKRQHRTTSSGAKIGVDGCGYQLEIRPTPANSPDDAMNEVMKIMKEIRVEYPNSELSAVGDAYPLGFHIHFGFPRGNFNPPSTLLKLLDDFLYTPTLALNGKARGSYLAPSQYEPKTYGFEYRSLPGALLCSPEITRLSFKIAHGLVQSYASNKVLSYHEYPNLDDYMKVAGLTEVEAQTWINFCLEDWKAVNMYRVLANWVEPGSLPKFKDCGAITFKDEWLKEVLDDVTKEMGAYMRRSHMNIDLMFYGLKESRGAMSTIHLGDGYRLLYNPGTEGVGGLPEFKDGVCYIGIPRRVRVDYEAYKLVRESLISSAKAKLVSFRTAHNGGRRRTTRVPATDTSAGIRRRRRPFVANTSDATILSSTPDA